MITELLPCPFCGHDTPEFVRKGTHRRSCIVACGNCGARHESGDEGDLSGSSWNSRAAAPAPKDAQTVMDLVNAYCIPVANLPAYDAVQSAVTAMVQERDDLEQDRDEWRDSTISANERFKIAERKVAELMQERDTLKAYNTTRTDELMAASRRIAALEAQLAAQPVAMTDKQIHRWWRSENGFEDCDMCKLDDFTKVVRAVEARGINAAAQGAQEGKP